MTYLLSALAIGGCSQADDESLYAPRSIKSPINQQNGEIVNGTVANGQRFNGQRFNGQRFNGDIINAVQPKNQIGSPPTLIGYDILGAEVSGAAFLNATIVGRYSNGTVAQVEVVGYDNSSIPGLDLYLVRNKSTHEPICGKDSNNQPIWATVMTSLFDEETGAEAADDPELFTFACRFGALEKCNEYGYPKWAAANEFNGSQRRLRGFADYHASCVRMVRADYCGNGQTHTFNGTSIDIFDHLEDTNAPATTDGVGGWNFEAEWEPDGGHCISKTRWMPSPLSTLADNRSNANPHWEYIRQNCPNRFAFPVQKPDGQWSVPDRACGTNSLWNTSKGFTMYGSGASRQPNRPLLRNHSKVEIY